MMRSGICKLTGVPSYFSKFLLAGSRKKLKGASLISSAHCALVFLFSMMRVISSSVRPSTSLINLTSSSVRPSKVLKGNGTTGSRSLGG